MVAIVEKEHPQRIDTGDQTVCHCHKIRSSQLKETIQREGITSVDELGERTGAGKGCGGCRCRLQRLVMGLPMSCGPCAFCTGCGSIQKLCRCAGQNEVAGQVKKR